MTINIPIDSLIELIGELADRRDVLKVPLGAISRILQVDGSPILQLSLSGEVSRKSWYLSVLLTHVQLFLLLRFIREQTIYQYSLRLFFADVIQEFFELTQVGSWPTQIR